MLKFFKFELNVANPRMVCVACTSEISIQGREEVYEQLPSRRIHVGEVHNITKVNELLGTFFATILIGNSSTWDKIKEGCLTGIVRADNVLFLTHPVCLQAKGFIEPDVKGIQIEGVPVTGETGRLFMRLPGQSNYANLGKIQSVTMLPKQVKSTIEQEFIRKVRLED